MKKHGPGHSSGAIAVCAPGYGVTTASGSRSRRLSPRNPRCRRDGSHNASIRLGGCRLPGHRQPIAKARHDPYGNNAKAEQSGWNEPGTRLLAFVLDDLGEPPDPDAEQDRGSANAEPAEYIAQHRGRGTQPADEEEVCGQRLDGTLQGLDAIADVADLPALPAEEVGDDTPFVAQFIQLPLLLVAALQQVFELLLLQLIVLVYPGQLTLVLPRALEDVVDIRPQRIGGDFGSVCHPSVYAACTGLGSRSATKTNLGSGAQEGPGGGGARPSPISPLARAMLRPQHAGYLCLRIRPLPAISVGAAAIAQLVEHIIRNDGVGGSNPSCGTSVRSVHSGHIGDGLFRTHG